MIQAFNDDMPYDQFVKAQIAGDLMDPKDPLQDAAGHRVSGTGSLVLRQRLERSDSRRRAARPRGRGHARFPRPDGCMRALPRSQVRSDSADRLLRAGRRFLQHDLRRVSAGAARRSSTNTRRLEDELDEKQKILQETEADSTSELSRCSRLQTSNYLEGVWEVTGKQKKEIAQVVNARKLDYELLERWIKYMGKPTDKYHNKDEWQAMMKKGGGTPAGSEETRRQVPAGRSLTSMLAKDEIDDENRSSPTRTSTAPSPRSAPTSPATSFRTRISIRARCCA